MNFLSFLNPALLSFLPLALVPLVIHLFQRQRARRILFPSLVFLRESKTSAWRRTRIEEWLLLLARMLLVALLVMAMAKPALRLRLPGWLGGSGEQVALIIDDSASMGTVGAGGDLFNEALRHGRQVLAGLGGDGLAAVISGSQGNAIISGLERTDNARARLDNMRLTPGGTDLAGAVQTADRILRDAGGSPRIVVISDFQRTALGDDPQPIGPLASGAIVECRRVGRPAGYRNLVWEQVELSPLRQRLIISGRLQNQGRASVRLRWRQRVISETQVNPDTAGRFSLSLGWPRSDSLSLSCSGDDLAADDVYYLPWSAADKTLCLIIGREGTQPVTFLTRALAALEPMDVSASVAEQPSNGQLAAADIIIVCDARPRRQLWPSLRQRQKAGAACLIAPPLDAERELYNQLLAALSIDLRLGKLIAADSLGANPSRLGRSAAAPAGQRFLESRDLAQIQVFSYWQASTTLPADLKIDQKDPALVVSDSSRAAVWLMGTDPRMSDLVFHPSYLVLLAEVIARLDRDIARDQYRVGQSCQTPATEDRMLNSPQGERLAPEIAGNSRRWRLDRAGWYRMDGTGETRLIAANIASGESDLTRLSDRELAALFRESAWRMDNAPGGRPGAPLRPAGRLFLLLAGAMLCVELVLRRAR